MPALKIEQLALKAPRRNTLRSRMWREWCFLRSVGRHLARRIFVVLIVLVFGALMFQRFEPEKEFTLAKAAFYTWSLAFGEPPEEYPSAPVLQVLFFVIPILGLTVILEGIVDFSFLVRDRKRYEREWCLTMAASLNNHVIVVGMGKLGYRAYQLFHLLGERVVVIEKDPKNRFLEEVRRDGWPLIIGDARDETLLVEANVKHARSVLCATNDDLANLEIALDARRFQPDIRIVCRMFDQNMADKIRDGFNIHIAMSQAAMSAPAFAMAAIDPRITNSFVVGDQLIVMQRWTVRTDGKLANKTVAEVMSEHSCGVAELARPGEKSRIFPPPQTKLRPGDQLLVQGPYHTLAKLTKRIDGGRAVARQKVAGSKE